MTANTQPGGLGNPTGASAANAQIAAANTQGRTAAANAQGRTAAAQARTPDAASDVWSIMMNNNVQRVIEDVILVDEAPTGYSSSLSLPAPYICTCGSCGAPNLDALEDGEEGQRYIAPRLFVESRTGTDPVLLDEDSVATELHIIAGGTVFSGKTTSPPATSAQAPTAQAPTAQAPTAQAPTAPAPTAPALNWASLLGGPEDDDFDPDSFNPFDPGVTEEELEAASEDQDGDKP